MARRRLEPPLTGRYTERVDKAKLLQHLTALDRALRQPTQLYIYGSAACILLDEPDRTSLDMDVAAPYSRADFADLQQAATAAGFPVNPPPDFQGDHLEWISAVRLCLPPPQPGSDLLLWQGGKLTVTTGGIAELIASKLIRYDPTDQADIQYLVTQRPLAHAAVAEAVARLPAPFAQDPVVLDNLTNLQTDLATWRRGAR